MSEPQPYEAPEANEIQTDLPLATSAGTAHTLIPVP